MDHFQQMCDYRRPKTGASANPQTLDNHLLLLHPQIRNESVRLGLAIDSGVAKRPVQLIWLFPLKSVTAKIAPATPLPSLYFPALLQPQGTRKQSAVSGGSRRLLLPLWGPAGPKLARHRERQTNSCADSGGGKGQTGEETFEEL